MQDYVRVRVNNVGELPASPNLSVLVLVDESEERCLNVLSDTLFYDEIFNYNEDKKEGITDGYYAVLKALFDDSGYRQLHLRITECDVEDPTLYHAVIVDELTEKRYPIVAEEGILLALELEFPIYVHKQIMLHDGFPYDPNAKGIKLSLDVLNYPLLQEALQDSVSREDYEMASKVRDEIRRRFPDKAQDNF